MTTRTPRFGIMQGRLSPGTAGRPQAFPHDTWREEFERAAGIGFGSIEWLFDEDEPAGNPLSTPAGRREAAAVSAATGVRVDTLCLHHFIDGQLWSPDAGERHRATETLRHILDHGTAIGARVAVLPALAAGSLLLPDALDRFRGALDDLAQVAGSCILAMETDLPAADLSATLRNHDPHRIGVCFDMGNVTALGYDLRNGFIQLQDRIVEVHVKDRIRGGGSRSLGDGDTDLKQAARLLRGANYTGPIVLETPVFDDWHRSASTNLATVTTVFEEGAS